jgi:hypothetical protein
MCYIILLPVCIYICDHAAVILETGGCPFLSLTIWKDSAFCLELNTADQKVSKVVLDATL